MKSLNIEDFKREAKKYLGDRAFYSTEEILNITAFYSTEKILNIESINL
jgi:hypothetical protein